MPDALGDAGIRHMDPVRIFFCDDHRLIRSAIRALLERDTNMVVVGEASDGEDAITQIAERRDGIDVVVMDISMPRMGGAEATARIREVAPNAKVLVLTAYDDASYVQMLLSAGASGYVLKSSVTDDLVRAIRAVAAGGVYVDPTLASALLVSPRSRRSPSSVVELSEREAEVLRGMARGYSMKEIASQLHVSPRTLETYRVRGMEKLGITSRPEIVRYAMQRGWLRDC